MNKKELIIEELTLKLKEMFVEDFDKVNGAKESINEYLLSINVESAYNYNDFCSDFLKVSDKLLTSLAESDLQSLEAPYIMSEIMSIMVRYKIMESEEDGDIRSYKLMQHELRMKTAGNIDSS